MADIPDASGLPAVDPTRTIAQNTMGDLLNQPASPTTGYSSSLTNGQAMDIQSAAQQANFLPPTPRYAPQPDQQPEQPNPLEAYRQTIGQDIAQQQAAISAGKGPRVKQLLSNFFGDTFGPLMGYMTPQQKLQNDLVKYNRVTALQTTDDLRKAQTRLVDLQAQNQELTPVTDFVTGQQMMIPRNQLATFQDAQTRTKAMLQAREQPKTLQQIIEGMAANAVSNGRDPNQDPNVQMLVKLSQSLQRPPAEQLGAQADERFRDIATKQALGQPVTREESAFVAAYRQQKQLSGAPSINLKTNEQSIEPVTGFDAQGRKWLVSQNTASQMNLTHVMKAAPGDQDKAQTHTSTLNDMQAKLNDVVDTRSALDQDAAQRAIIANALSYTPKEGGVITDAIQAFAALGQAGALKGASQKTQDYIQSVLSLRESALGLPKELTGGSRVSEIQASALWRTLPDAASLNGNYALSQARRFQANIDRLRLRSPLLEGNPPTAPHSDLAGGPGNNNANTGGQRVIQYERGPDGKLHPKQ